jgi:competence protein ComGD
MILFMQQLQSRCLYVQESSFYTKKDKDVEIQDRQAFFDNDRFSYPKGISCTPFSFHYNENGNISKAGTVHCQNGKQRKKMVFQLGMGRIRIE